MEARELQEQALTGFLNWLINEMGFQVVDLEGNSRNADGITVLIQNYLADHPEAITELEMKMSGIEEYDLEL